MEHNQTESQIEDRFIRHLKGLGYVHRTDIKDRASLEENFRNKFEALNGVRLTDGEFERLMGNIVSSDVYKASKTLRDKVKVTHEDGTTRYYPLLNLQNWCKNEYEVINQLRINTHSSHHRYDVIILINGLPLVQVELKTHGVSPRVAIKQIVDYKNDRGNGYEHTLLAFMQLFIVSNEADTFYFANNPKEALTFDEREQFLPVCRWANEQNKKVTNLHEFAREVLYKCALGELVSRYMVLVETERKLIIMRPYQIYAVKKMVECIENNAGNGYIWHTTGSGKTLTSFKAATLLKDNPHIAKCFFVVDRKDLDKQTREEFNKFQKGCVEENTNTGKLVQRMLSNEHKDKIIVTTIQKLGLALNEKGHHFDRGLRELADQRVVFIFDECHRSQFGEYHRAIKSFFPRAQLFGFTGTPIFAKNATRSKIEGREASALTTEDIFQKPLHTYAITHAIEDKSVLPFDVSFFRLRRDGSFDTGNVPKEAIVEKILEVHDKVSDNRRFNALFATASINDAIEYCRLFDDAQFKREEQDSSYKRLRIACLFSPPAEGNRDIMQIQEELEQERQDNQVNPLGKKEALRRIISIYQKTYGGNFCIEEFDRYNCDVQERIKKQGWDKLPREEKIDITIVVDMLLTGFDSKYLGTLYVDKGLQYHGLIQAFSRTNRVLNDRKPFGKILDFRAQSADALNTAVELFSGERDKTKEVTKIWLVESAHEVVQQFEEAVRQFRSVMESRGLAAEPEEVPNLAGDIARAEFVERFKEVQRLKLRLDQYLDITPEDQQLIEAIMPPEKHQAFRTAYLEAARQLRQKQAADSPDSATGPDAMQQDIDFELVLFASAIIDYDYIMALISRLVTEEPERREMTREELVALIRSHSNLPDEQDDILDFIQHPEDINGRTAEEISDDFRRFREAKWNRHLRELAHRHGVDQERLSAFIESTLDIMRYDDGRLSDLFTDADLDWLERVSRKNHLRADLIPLIRRRAAGQEVDSLPAS